MYKIAVFVMGLSVAMLGLGRSQVATKAEAHILEETDWMGKNGKNLRAVYVKDDAATVQVMNLQTKRTYKLAKANLHPETLAWFKRAKAAEFGGGAEEPAAPAKRPHDPFADGGYSPEAPDGFVPIEMAKLKRADVPMVDLRDSYLSAFVTYFMWWDEYSNLKVPRGRDFERKVEWLEDEFARRFKERSTVAINYDDIVTGLADYFEKRFEGEASHVLIRPPVELDKLPAYLEGGSAAILGMEIFVGDDSDGNIAVPLLAAEADGTITFNYRGEKYRGLLKPNPETSRDPQYPGYIFHFDSATPPPKDGMTMELTHKSWGGGLYVLTPFVRAPAEGVAN